MKFGAGIIPICEKTGKILLQKRAKEISFPNTWATFGGKGETGETHKETAIREFREESGFKGQLNNIEFIYSHKKNSFTFYNYLGLVKTQFTPNTIGKETDAGHIEIQDAKWIDIDAFENMSGLHYGMKALIKDKKSEIKKYIDKYCKK